MYEQSFGLTTKPFQLTPDPDFFFSSRGHSRARAFLEYGILQKEGFIVITGEIGAGKTTLIRGLLRSIEQQPIVAAQIVSTQVGADDMLRLVAQVFGMDLPGSDKAAVLGRLEAYFRALHSEGKRALLIIDEAQNLSPRAVEELRMLSNFQIGMDALVQSFLVGQPEFRRIMQRPELRQLKQRVIASYHLGPLDRPETRLYIQHRLRRAGWSGKPAIEGIVYDQVFDFTDGVPRRINTLCDRLLLDCYLDDRNSIGELNAREVILEFAKEFGVDPAASTSPAETSSGIDGMHGMTQVRMVDQVHPSDDLVALHENENNHLPTRFDQLEARIRKVEASQDTLQRMMWSPDHATRSQLPIPSFAGALPSPGNHE